MDNSYADYIISKHSKFLDPFSLTEISIERLCYPVVYANEDMIKGWQGISLGKDMEDDLLTKQSLLKDLPSFEKCHLNQTYITDGASHILRNKQRENFVQLVGMPKIGKSTLLKKIALLAAQDMKQDPFAPVPLLINLENAMKDEISSKMEMIEACFSQCEEFEAYLRERFFQGKILLLLDELDKVTDLSKKIIEWIKALKTYVKLPLCVVCSRYSGYIDFETLPTLYIDIYPLKLQISTAQNMLSEFQFERFVELITGPYGHFCELASTPYLFSLLLEMFRWGTIGTDKQITRGKLYHLAVKHIISNYDNAEYWTALEVLATDLLLRDCKSFGFLDVKNLGFEHLWENLKSSMILLEQSERKKIESEASSDDEMYKEGLDSERCIGEAKETFSLPTLRHVSRHDTTPQWVSNSKESYYNYQIARKCIFRTISNDPSSESYRFLHLRILEILAAQNYLKQIEDSIKHSTGGFLIESSAFQKAFTLCFPNNFLFCRRFREVLMFFCTLCSENVFENFIKFLLNKETSEHSYIVESLLKERGLKPGYRPLINKLKHDKLNISKKAFMRSFAHPSLTVQKLCRNDAIESGLQDHDLLNIVSKNIDLVLKNTHWLYLKQLITLSKDINSKIIKSIFSKLYEVSVEMLNNVTKPGPYKVIVHKVFLFMFLSAFERGNHSSHQPTSNFTPRVSSYTSPKKPETNTEESTIRISFDKIKFPKNDGFILEKIANTGKLISVLIDLIQICPTVDISLCVKNLMILGCSISQIHTSLAGRFACLEDNYERKEILKALRMLGFVTQHTVDIPLVCLNLDKDLQILAKDILKLLNTEKLKKHAVKNLVKEDSPHIKLLLALRALGFTAKEDIDQEVVYFLVQFIDHYTLELRLEAIKSLYMVLKIGKKIDSSEIRKTLAVVPHVLKDRIKLPKYDVSLRVYSLKCLIALWISLDKGKEDSNATQMFHILVKEQIGSSFLVGSLALVLGVVKDFMQRSGKEREAAWVCLRKMSPILDYLDIHDRTYLINEMKIGLSKQRPYEVKYILKVLLVNTIPQNDKLTLLTIILSTNFESEPKLIKYIALVFANWNEILLIKTLMPNKFHINPELHNILNKLRLLIDQLNRLLENSEDKLKSRLKHLDNWYKFLVNQIAESIPWPCKIFPHKNQLLDISADPSFFKEQAIPEISYSFVDIDVHPGNPNIPQLDFIKSSDGSQLKNSIDSVNTVHEDNPPQIELCQQLILAGVRSEGLKYWILWYLKHSDNITDFTTAAECWNIISQNKDFYNPSVENLLLKFLHIEPDKVAKSIVCMKFKSDSFCVKLINSMIKNEFRTESAYKAIVTSMELNSPLPLEEVYKMACFSCQDSQFMYYLHNCAAKVLENIIISSDGQLHSVLKALVSTGCSLFIQPIWNYVIKSLSQKSGYLLSVHAVGILENCPSWDCKFLISRFRMLGLMPVDIYHKETGSSMSTKKI